MIDTVTAVIDASETGQPFPDEKLVLKALNVAFPNVAESFVAVAKPSACVVILEWLDGPSIRSAMKVLERATGSHKGILYRRIVGDTLALRNFFHRMYRLPLDDKMSYPSVVAKRVCPHHNDTGMIAGGREMLELLATAVDLPYRGYTPKSRRCPVCGSENREFIYCEECGEKIRKTGEDLLEELSGVPFSGAPWLSEKKFLHFRKGTDLYEILTWIQHYNPEVASARAPEFLRQARRRFEIHRPIRYDPL